MYRCAEARAVGDHSILLFSPAAAEHLGHNLLVGERTGPACCHPLIMLLQYGVGFGSVEVISRGAVFQCSQPPVLIDRDHHRGLAAQVYEVVLVVVSRGL
jgi:hypothetical protein